VSNYVEIQADGWRFQPRVAAVCLWQDHVLLQQSRDGAFWVLAGGRLLPLELTADALVRTLHSEIGEEITIRRLLWVMEYVAPMDGQPVHELGFYYAVDLPKNSPFLDVGRDHAGVERGHQLMLRWFPVDALPNVPLFPDFLRSAVRQIPNSTQHIVQVDTGSAREG
jgi:ADP-ribose pyrophosphatase YjhB (NUDIX family)